LNADTHPDGINHKKREKSEEIISFASAGCSLLRAGGFSWKLDYVLYVG
jgi:hypothetical protein